MTRVTFVRPGWAGVRRGMAAAVDRPPRPGGYDSEDSDASVASKANEAPVVVRVKRKRAWASSASDRLVVSQRPSSRLTGAVLSAELGRKSVLNADRDAPEDDEKGGLKSRVGLGGFEASFLFRRTAYARVCCVPAHPAPGALAGGVPGSQGGGAAPEEESLLWKQREEALREEAVREKGGGMGGPRRVLREVGRERAGEAPKRRRLRLPVEEHDGDGGGHRVVDARVVELEMVAEDEADEGEDDVYVYDYYMESASGVAPGGDAWDEGGDGGHELLADVAVYDEDLLVLEGELSADEREYDPRANGEDYDSNDERHERTDYPEDDGESSASSQSDPESSYGSEWDQDEDQDWY